MLLSSDFAPQKNDGHTDPYALAQVWRASELARSRAVTCPTGYQQLDEQLPGRGWPRSGLTELLLRQSGVGELQLLRPALAQLSKDRRIVLVQPPYIPQSITAHIWGIDATRMLWVRAKATADALWATEQIIKSGNFGAVLFWQLEVRAEALRRLNLVAQNVETWFWMFRPLSCATEASPASLRLGLSPARGGIDVALVKRLGPPVDGPFFVPLADMPAPRHPSDTDHASRNEPIPASTPAPVSTTVMV